MGKKITPAKACTYVVLSVWALTTLYPFVWVILNSFREKGLIRKDSFSLPLPGRRPAPGRCTAHCAAGAG